MRKLYRQWRNQAYWRNQTHPNFSSLKALRNPDYQTCTADDISYFKSFLKENQVLTDNLEFYNKDWMKMYTGCSKVCLLPDTTEKLSRILSYCNNRSLAVVPQGGNTGVVGGSVSVFDEIVVSLSKMNQIINLNQQNNVLTAEAGVILETANRFLQPYNLEIPWDLGAKGSCVLGGNVSTHAGGQYFVKHGPMRANILGMEVVLANGEVLDMRSEIRKDNTGIDLKQLFIGSEGSLGVITKLNILCTGIDKHKNLLLIKCSNYENILTMYQHSRSIFSSNLSALEWMDGTCFDLVTQMCKETCSNPFADSNASTDYYLLVEVNSDDQDVQQHFLETIMNVQGFKDCVKAENDAQYKQLWSLRESVAIATTRKGEVAIGYDLSLDIQKMDELTKIIRNRLQKYDCVVFGFGHIGDSNLHLNLALNKESERNDIERIVEPFVYEYTAQLKGSISAEHGMGQMKSQFLPLQKSQLQIDLMKKLKRTFDQKQILNPYKIWPI